MHQSEVLLSQRYKLLEGLGVPYKVFGVLTKPNDPRERDLVVAGFNFLGLSSDMARVFGLASVGA